MLRGSDLVQIFDPLNRRIEYIPLDPEYDFFREVANMGYGDMLHDKERNSKYYAAIRKVIGQKRQEIAEKLAAEREKNNDEVMEPVEEIHVLDIGTGTGLLAMMADEAGADRVTACEAFQYMADCAERILLANNKHNRIHLLKKSSKEINLEKDLNGRRPNILVAELLDTELIGEGAIFTYNHAHRELLSDDSICIPYKAICYAQVVQSPLAVQWNSLKTLTNLDGDIQLKIPKRIQECNGIVSLHSIQLSELSTDLFTPLTDPVEIMEVNFNQKKPLDLHQSLQIPLTAKITGSTDLVFYWWAIHLDREGEIVINCAPYWAHPDYKPNQEQQNEKDEYDEKKDHIKWKKNLPWRDHWMQAIYFIPKPIQFTSDDIDDRKFILYFNHDPFSLWFNVSRPISIHVKLTPIQSLNNRNVLTDRHNCTCFLHLAYSRSRIGQMNQTSRNKKYLSVLEELNITKDTNILILGDGCLLGLMLTKFGAGKTWLYETGHFSRQFMLNIIKENDLKNVHVIDDFKYISDEELKKIRYVIAEPYFLTSILPWDNFQFGSLLEEIEMSLYDAIVLPQCARIYALPVAFKDLYKLNSPVRECEGFDMEYFDRMIEDALAREDKKIESHPLWEYPCIALGKPQCILQIDFHNFCGLADNHGIFPNLKGKLDLNQCNAICLWVDWFLDGVRHAKTVISTGPSRPVVVGEIVTWDMFTSQGVYFLTDNSKDLEILHIDWTLYFNTNFGVVTKFSIQRKDSKSNKA